MIKAKFGKAPAYTRGSDGTTYGAAEDRYSHTPISFQSLPNNETGEYLPPSILQKLFGGKGDIFVDPNKPDMSQTIRHEATHAALLQNLSGNQIDSLNKNNPFYNAYVDNLSAANRITAGPTEVPAYAAENFNIQNPELRSKYVNQMNSQLQTVNPNLAAMYSRLAK
jgi:hypothetical protein